MLPDLSGEARDMIRLARAEAQSLDHYYIGTEHIFLGLCQSTDKTLGEVVKKWNLDSAAYNQVRSALTPESVEPIWGREFIYTPRSQQVLQLAGTICNHLQSDRTYPSHIMMAILVEGRGMPVKVLENLGLDLVQLIEALAEVSSAQVAPAESSTEQYHTPSLNRYGRDLTELAKQGKLAPVIGREKELQQMAYILKKKTKSNPLIIGEAGVGKTHLVAGLAQEIASQKHETMRSLADIRIIEIDLNSLVAGTIYRGEFEARLDQIIKEATGNRIILFIDELHTLMSAGAATGSHGAAQIMKPYLSRGDIQCIGATTLKDYSEFVEGDKALARRFEIIQLDQPDSDETINILRGLRPSYEKHHEVKILDDALEAAVEYAARYISDRFFPDKAIDLLDGACAKESLSGADSRSTVNRSSIADIVYQKVGSYPEPQKGDKQAIIKLEAQLSERVIGQEEAVKAVVEGIKKVRAGIASPQGPNGVFLLGGPTGVGKTELARALGEALFGDEKAIVRLDMSEYMEAHAVSRLIGAPPGYVGYGEGGLLTDPIRRRPYSIVLLDEIEKAHPKVLNVLLQVFEDGRLTDGRGRVADFSNTVILMTSNLGMDQMKSQDNIGFASKQETSDAEVHDSLKKAFHKAADSLFAPEFRNRIDSVIVFRPLSRTTVRQIIDKFLRQIHERPGLRGRNITLELDEDAYNTLMKYGYSAELGAREMSRVIERLIVVPLAEELINHEIPKDTKFRVSSDGGHIRFVRDMNT